jgi:hypothetical protein
MTTKLHGEVNMPKHFVDKDILFNDKGCFFNPPTTNDTCQYLPGGELNDKLPEDALIRQIINHSKKNHILKLRRTVLGRCLMFCFVSNGSRKLNNWYLYIFAQFWDSLLTNSNQQLQWNYLWYYYSYITFLK